MKTWKHNELAQDLADVKYTNFLDVPLGSVYLDFYDRSYGRERIAENNIQRADVITVKPSYHKFSTSIYEIKISRADFLSDIRSEKWRGYLGHCNRFYFAVPSGMVKKEEIPKEAGLIIRGETGWSTIKPAEVRDIEIPYMTLLSMIFSKQRRRYESQIRNKLKAAYDENWIYHRERFYKKLGAEIGEALRKKHELDDKREEYESLIESLRQDIIDGLGDEYCNQLRRLRPEWELSKLVRQIKERASGQ